MQGKRCCRQCSALFCSLFSVCVRGTVAKTKTPAAVAATQAQVSSPVLSIDRAPRVHLVPFLSIFCVCVKRHMRARASERERERQGKGGNMQKVLRFRMHASRRRTRGRIRKKRRSETCISMQREARLPLSLSLPLPLLLLSLRGEQEWKSGCDHESQKRAGARAQEPGEGA